MEDVSPVLAYFAPSTAQWRWRCFAAASFQQKWLRVLKILILFLNFAKMRVLARIWSSWNILSSIGLMHLSASSISSVCLYVAVWVELARGISLFCHLTAWVHEFRRQPDDMELTAETPVWFCSHHLWSYLFLDDYLRHFSFQSTNVCSALEAFGYINLSFTYLLTHIL